MTEAALNTPPRSILINRDAEGLAHAVAARLITKLVDVQSSGRVAQVVLTGGRVAAVVYRAVAESPARSAIDWRRVEFWWGDERFLPEGDPERNDTQAWDALLSHVDVDPALVHVMPADTGQGAEAAAAAYAETLAAAAGPRDGAVDGEADGPAFGDGVPAFDVLMLGVGPDGHVASLFPDNPARIVVDKSTVAVHDSPKPPPTRVSLTFPALANARETWFVVSGEDKADAVAGALSGTSDLPASIPQGIDRTLWLLDEAAASKLPQN
ncbi:6-phosphogluconolactonase [Kribbella sp. NPDC023855]|uniref:6-phosphogluconolactonase n=1 Tax=Kribbella sp. NPDC023855 TaxID=3154698 RepID=UPI0033C6D362